MYKFLDKKRVRQIKKIENEFQIISKTILREKFNFNWWLHEVSRLDFRPWGGLNTRNFLNNDVKLIKFYYKFIKDLFIIISFIIKGLFFKEKKFFYKNIFIYENVLFNKEIKNFYFDGIYNKTKFKNKIVIGLSKDFDKNTICLNSLISFKDRIKFLYQSIISQIKIFFFLKKLIKQKKINKFWIDFFFIKQNLKNFYINLIIFNFISKNTICKNIIFPYEEKTLERSIILALADKVKKKDVKIFGVCVNPQHILSSFLKNFEGIYIPRTNNYLYCGPLYRKYFKRLKRKNVLTNSPENDCIGSLKSKIVSNKQTKNKTFLVLLSHIDEYYRLIEYIEEKKNLQKYKFIIRTYPHSMDEIKIFNHLKKKSFKNLEISKVTLKKDIEKAFAVIFSGTSAGIEAINFGRVAMWSNLSNVGINPLFDEVNHFFPNFNASQFEKKINFLSKLDNITLLKILKKQQKFCKKIYSKLNIKVIDKNLNNN